MTPPPTRSPGLPELPEPETATAGIYRFIYYTADQMRERDRQIVELCGSEAMKFSKEAADAIRRLLA